MKTFREYLKEVFKRRSEMPQIKSPDLKNYLDFLSAKGIKSQKELVEPNLLTPCQEIDKDKVNSMIQNKADISKDVVVDQNYQIIDGHHRWAAHLELDKKIPVLKINAPWDIIYNVTSKFSGVRFEENTIREDTSNDREITKQDLNKIEKYLDALFSRLGIDVEFTKHFLERINDTRNNKQITMRELVDLFTKHYKENGKKIAQLGPDHEAVLKDFSSNINLPIALNWNRDTGMLEMAVKTIMRKKDFIAKGKIFNVR